MYFTLKSAFDRQLNTLHGCYDEKEDMLLVPFHSPGYHTTLKGGRVHPTRNAFNYAVALLDSGAEEYRQRAIKILKKVIPLQDTNPESKTYGIWSWFLEEPLTKMSPPDWNWADFCGKQLLQVALDHFHRLDVDLMELVKEAIIHACNAIMLRNVGPGYTNISLMGTYVTHVAGELFENEEILKYAKKRLENLYQYNMGNGEFTEYNSPTYTVIAIEEISAMLLHIKDPNSVKMLEELNEMAWGCLARHFHLPSRQWAGPHSRCYTNLLPKKVLSFIQIATRSQVVFMDEEALEIETSWVRIKLNCPEKFYPYFTTVSSGRVEKKVFNRGNERSFMEMENGYFTETYVLSSFYRANLWNQKRPLLAYFGTADKPTYMQLRCLHNGYDFCSAHLQCIQEKNHAMGVINFYTDGGDTHPNLDMVKNATIRAHDLRIRLEFGGDIEKIQAVEKVNETYFDIRLNNLGVSFSIMDALFGESTIQYEKGMEDGKLWIDVILYEGKEKEIDFNRIEKAYVAFALKIESHDDRIQNHREMSKDISVARENGKIKIVMQGKKAMAMEALDRASTYKAITDNLKGYINDIPYEQTCTE